VISPQPAATVILVRDADAAVEVLLLERRADSGFVPGAFVFPGGALDAADHDPSLAGWCDGPTDARASQELGLPAGGFAYRVAAVREAFEEAGVLLATDDAGAPCDGPWVDRLEGERVRLDEGATSLAALASSENLRFGTSRLRPFAHWITPEGAPRRYDTRFFVAPAPADQRATPCQREVVSAVWMTPAAALARSAGGDLPLILPTERCLRAIDGFTSVDSLLAALDADLQHAEGPRFVADRGGRRLAVTAPAREGSAA
jgi:8-oxo-dGTP pyrophosphatase MutT (NUDIX family)